MRIGPRSLALAWLARVATFVFVIYYTALDFDRRLRRCPKHYQYQRLEARQLTPEQVKGVAAVIDTTWIDQWVGGVGSFISKTGSWAVFAATVFLALALFWRKKAPWRAADPARRLRLGAAG